MSKEKRGSKETSRGANSKGSGGHRVQRVEREIREVIGNYLLGSFRGEVPGIVSVSRVICSKDLRQAKVLVTLMGMGADGKSSKADQKTTVLELQSHAHQIQGEVNRRLQMKHCPRLTFFYDDGFENALKVESILRKLGQEKTQTPASETEVSHDETENEP